jgi:two-component system, cell cycle sensor histidine kinase and response regulator CckA
MAANGQTVLVVEDNEETLNILSRTLAAGGYDVIWARNGADTMKLLTRHDGPIALIIVDVVLPGMSGPELVARVSRRYPRAAALYVSAYDPETVRSHGVDPDTMRFLPKPYEPSELLSEVEAALDA